MKIASKRKSFRITLDLLLNQDDTFWDHCIDNFCIMYWATDNVVIQVNPMPRVKE